jgi:hypothetical protein
MLLLARCLDWLCAMLASGVENETRINTLICPLARHDRHKAASARRD